MWSNKYIGLPYKEYGRDESGVDCWGLACLVYKQEFNIELPSFATQYLINDREHIQELLAQNQENWVSTETPVKGTLVLFRILGHEAHVGIVLDNNRFLHVREGSDSVIESLDNTNWRNRIVGYYNYSANTGTQITAVPHPLRTEKIHTSIPPGTTLDKLVPWIDEKYSISEKLKKHIVILLNGRPVPQDQWPNIVLLETDVVEYRALPAGDSLRAILVLVIVVVIAINFPQLAGSIGSSLSGGTLAAGSTAALAIGTGVIQIGASILVNTILPIRPPQFGTGTDPGSAERQLMISGAANRMTPYSAIPVVLGKVRITPPLGAASYQLFDSAGTNAYIKMLLAWGYGPLEIYEDTYKIGELPLSTFDGVTKITLNRKTTETTAEINAFNNLYGNDITQIQSGVELTCDGAPGSETVDPGPWLDALSTDADDPDTPAIEQISTVTVAIHFPQGCRKIASKGDSAGNSYDAIVNFQIQWKKQSELTWTMLQVTPTEQFNDVTVSEYNCYSYGDGDTSCGYENVTRRISTGYIYPENILTGVAESYGRGVISAQIGRTPVKDAFTLTRTITVNSSEPVQVRVRRLTGTGRTAETNPDYQYAFTSVLQNITFTRNTSPAVDPLNCKIAKTAIQLKASDQLSNSIEGINAIVQTYCLDWNNSGWVLAATNNPASLFRYVLQHPANPQRVTDADVSTKIDLAQLQYWHAYCVENNLTFNSVLGAQRSILDVLRDICAAGRGSPALKDGKWTVVIDEPRETIVQHFTPHNSWGFEGTKVLPKMPDGLRVTYFDEAQGYQEAEIIVYAPGKSQVNSELFEAIQLPGVTNKAQVISLARWHYAQITLRPEVYTINTDLEYIVCNRGDRVKLTHDIPMWGLGSGRIKNRVDATTFELDELIPYEVGTQYTMRVRSSNGTSTVRQLKNSFTLSSRTTTTNSVTVTLGSTHPFSVGDYAIVSSSLTTINNSNALVTAVTSNTVTYTTGSTYTAGTSVITGTISLQTGNYSKISITADAVLAAINAEDLYLYGKLTQEAQDLLVLSIEPTTNKSARLTLVDYGVTDTYNIFTDYETLTDATVFESQITLPPITSRTAFGTQVPTITTLVSDETALEVISPGVFRNCIRLSFTNPAELSSIAYLAEVQYDYGSADGEEGVKRVLVDYSSKSASLIDVQEAATYKVRMRYVGRAGEMGAWTEWVYHTVVGRLTPPQPVTNFAYSVDANTALIQLSWIANTELDLAGYEIRTTNTEQEWGNTNYVWKGDATKVDLKLLAAGTTTTYYIRSFDYAKKYSTTSASITYTVPQPQAVIDIEYSFGTTSTTNSKVTINWNAPVAQSIKIKEYEITITKPGVKVGTTLQSVTEVSYNSGTTHISDANWLGNATISIVSIDIAGNRSTAASTPITKSVPGFVTNINAEIIDNNVLLRWDLPTVTTLPIAHVLIKRGLTWATADKIIGEKQGTFTSNFELTAGTYTYWLAAVDTDGRESEPKPIAATVSQPPDFIFNGEYISSFTGTRVNASIVPNTNELLLLTNDAETWAQHFTTNSWTSPTSQIAAGYPIYSQPGLSTASYTEILTLGTVLPSSNITVSFSGLAISGNPTITVTIETRLGTGAWSSPVTALSVFKSNFDQIRITVNATRNTAGDLYLVQSLNTRLDSKQITDSGNVAAVNTDSLGTVVNFNREFVDVASITTTAAGTTPIIVNYNFNDSVSTATYVVTTNVCTVTLSNHGFIVGQKVRLSFTSGTATSTTYIIASVPNTSTFTVSLVTANTSGNVSVYAQSMRIYAHNTSGTRVSCQVSWSLRGY